MESSYKFVSPIKPVAPYLGGKSRLAERLIERIDGLDHDTYAEPFIGMGGVFFRRHCQPKCEVINDLSKDITTFFRVLQRHYTAFLEMMRFQLTTRAEFERLKATNPTTLTDLERAARFLYLQRNSFGGKATHDSFGVSPGRSARFNVTEIGPLLEDMHSRLAGVIIENLSYSELIKRYDRPATLFYLDPPYFGGENDYGKGLFSRPDFTLLAEQLADIKGTFVLSINDVPEIREVFAAFHFEGVETTYSISKEGTQTVPELIVSNRETGPAQASLI